MLDAAQRLFAASGPLAVSLRDIAAEAGVTYSLIGRHFGSKDELLVALLARYADRWAPRLAGAEDFAGAIATLAGPRPEPGEYLRLLAWTLLSPGQEPSPGGTAVLDALVPLAVAEDGVDTHAEARAATAMALSLVFGWRFFEPFLTEALHLTRRDVAAIHAEVRNAAARVPHL